MKLLLLIIILSIFSPLHSEELHFTKKQVIALNKYNLCFDSIYTKKLWHGKDSTAAVKRMNRYSTLFNK